MRIVLVLAVLSAISTWCDNKVVLISGATRGIGLATARAFQQAGWSVWAGCHQSVPHELQNLENVHLCWLDVTSEASVQAAVAEVLAREGKIDLLINNAGYGIIGAEECITISEAQHIFEINFFGALRLIQAVLPCMRKKRSGHIMNISSAAGVQAIPGLSVYCASKFALEGLIEALAPTMAQWDIQVTLVEPGFVKTDFAQHCAIGSRECCEERYARLARGTHRMLEGAPGQLPEEVAAQLVCIAKTAKPDLRYQTTAQVTQYIAEKLVDPTGNISKQENAQFLSHILRQGR